MRRVAIDTDRGITIARGLLCGMHAVLRFLRLILVTGKAQRIQFQSDIAAIVGLKAGVLHGILIVFRIEVGVTIDTR